MLAVRKNRDIFVEPPMDEKLAQYTMEKKSQLTQYGMLMFMVIGGSGYIDFWTSDPHVIPEIMKEFKGKYEVLYYYHGKAYKD